VLLVEKGVLADGEQEEALQAVRLGFGEFV
jgi:hypothetical protein